MEYLLGLKSLEVTAPLIPLGIQHMPLLPDHQVVQHGRQFFFFRTLAK